MTELNITSVQGALTVLEVAQEHHEVSLAYLEAARQRWQLAIEALQTMMDEDPVVRDALRETAETQALLDRAEEDAKATALIAWQSGSTGDRKEWRQDGWAIRIRASLVPTVTDHDSFLAHLKEIGAGGIIKDIKISLNRKAATDLNDRVSLRGLKVEERVSASLTKES